MMLKKTACYISGQEYKMNYYIHESVAIDAGAIIGAETKVWNNTHIRGGAVIGKNCNIGQNVYVDNDVIIGNFCKLQNNVNIYEGVILEDYVFCGPSMTFTNVKFPRCLYPTDKKNYVRTIVRYGATIGANATIVCGVTIGRHSMVGSGSVVIKSVEDYALVVGNPAKQIGWVCECGEKLTENLICDKCNRKYNLCNGRMTELIRRL